MGAPRDPQARAAAEARVAEVYAAIEAATDDPALQAELRRRCRTESWCNWYGELAIHDGDASLGRVRWKRAVARGLLRPDECEAHQLGDDPRWWSTVGAFGTVAAYVVRHAGPCVGPKVLADPDTAAELAVAHTEVLCRRHHACTCPARARWWAGPGRWDRRSPWRNLAAVRIHCGDPGAWGRLRIYASVLRFGIQVGTGRAEQLGAAAVEGLAMWLERPLTSDA